MSQEDGRFRPGTSGNPGGRPKNILKLRQMAEQHAATAIYSLAKQTVAHGVPARDRRAAAKLLLVLGFGPATGIGTAILEHFGWANFRHQLEDQAARDEREYGAAARRALDKIVIDGGNKFNR